jgi:hypothetical protein
MTDPTVRQIASDITLIAIALLAVTFVLLSLTWKGFLQRWLKMPSEQRKPLVKTSFILMIPIILPLGVTTAIGTYWPTIVRASYILVMILLAIIATLYILFVGFRKMFRYLLRKQKGLSPIKIDSIAIVYSCSLMLLAMSVFCNAFALIGTINTAMDIHISQYEPQDFNLARWLLTDAVLFFVTGMFASAYAYLDDKSSEWKTPKSKEVEE